MKQELIDSNPVLKLSLDFALSIVEYCESLEKLHKYVIARQLLKAGTAIGANTMEAQNAESKVDFIHKMKLAAKEAEETQYWLLICSLSQNYPDCNILLSKLESVAKILSSILSSSKNKLTK